MQALMMAARNFIRDEEGITAIEYGLIAAVIAGVIVIAFGTIGQSIEDAFETIGTTITDSASAATPAP